MKRQAVLWSAILGLLLGPSMAVAQFGGWGGGAGRGRMGGGEYVPPAPKMPGAELEGPADPSTAQQLLNLTDDQAAQYDQMYEDYRAATQSERDSVEAARTKMYDRLDAGDRAAAEFYAQRIEDLGKMLKDQQDKFEKGLRKVLNGDQQKAYQHWKDEQDRQAEERNREEALRWRQAAMGGRGQRGGALGSVIAEPKAYPRNAAIPAPDLGSQAVRVGHTIYASPQFAVDSFGTIVADGDLESQARRAFANLAAVLRTAGAWPQDVVSLTVYVVDYRPRDLDIIRDAGAAFFGPNPPVATVVGVESLGRERALISVGATAISQAAGFASSDNR